MPERPDPSDSAPGWSSDPALVLLAFHDHWTCALLRAELLERGVAAVCLRAVAAALLPASPVSLAAPLVVVAEQASPAERAVLGGRDGEALAWLRALGVLRAAVLVTSADADVIDDAWDRVMRRPIVLGDIADVAKKLAGAGASSPGHRRRGRVRSQTPTVAGFEIRIGPPWPAVRCTRCSASRQCEAARTESALGEVRANIATFGLAHAGCRKSSLAAGEL